MSTLQCLLVIGNLHGDAITADDRQSQAVPLTETLTLGMPMLH